MGSPGESSSALDPKKGEKQNQETAETADENQILETALDFTHESLPPPYEEQPPLSKPVAVPQIDFGPERPPGPYMRAYSLELGRYGVSMETFMKFLDGLNIVCTESPVLQATGIASDVVGAFPSLEAQIISPIVGFAAGFGAHVVNYTQRDKYLKRANDDFFHARRLHVEVLDIRWLSKYASIPEDAPRVVPLDVNSVHLTTTGRRLAAIQPWICPLTTDVPPPAPQTAMLKKLCEKQLARRTREAEEDAKNGRLQAWKQGAQLAPQEEEAFINSLRDSHDPKVAEKAEKIAKRRREEAKDFGEDRDYYESDRKDIEEEFRHEIKSARRDGDVRREEKAITRREKDHAKVDARIEKEAARRQRRADGKDKEVKSAQKGKWLVIRPYNSEVEETQLTAERKSTMKEARKADLKKKATDAVRWLLD